MKIKLSDRLKLGSQAAPWVAESIIMLEAQNEQLISLLEEVMCLYPYINCLCGRNKQRISNEIRDKIRQELKK